jgi:hypothetical protein
MIGKNTRESYFGKLTINVIISLSIASVALILGGVLAAVFLQDATRYLDDPLVAPKPYYNYASDKGDAQRGITTDNIVGIIVTAIVLLVMKIFRSLEFQSISMTQVSTLRESMSQT